MGNNHGQEDQLAKSLGEMQILMNNTANLKSRPLESTLRDTARRSNEISREMDGIAKENAKHHQAVLDTAKNTKEISDKVKSIEGTVSTEREERKSADTELQNAIERIRKAQRFANIKALIVGIVCAAAGVLLSIIAKGYGLL